MAKILKYTSVSNAENIIFTVLGFYFVWQGIPCTYSSIRIEFLNRSMSVSLRQNYVALIVKPCVEKPLLNQNNLFR